MSLHDQKETESGKPMTRRQLLASVGAAGALLAVGAGLPLKARAARNDPQPVKENKSWYNVRDFGALGTGTYYDDDTPYIQSAIDAASVEGGTVFLPAGKYSIRQSLNLRAKVSLLGAGAGSTIIKAVEPNLNMVYRGPGTGAIGIENIAFEGLGPSGSGEMVERAIYLLETSHTTIRGCVFNDIANGIRAARSQHMTIADCAFTKVMGTGNKNEGYGIIVEGGSNHIIESNHFNWVSANCIYLTAGCSYCVVSRNVMEVCKDAAIMLSSQMSSCSYHLIESNVVSAIGLLDTQSSCTHGIRLKNACSYNTIVNNVITRPETSGIQLEAVENPGDDRPYGNTIASNTIVSTVNGISIINGDANSVKGNEVRRVKTGILLDTVGPGTCKRTVVTGNTLNQCADAAIKINSARCESNVVFGNAGFENGESVKDSGTGTATSGF